MNRLSEDAYFMLLAVAASTRSTCLRGRVGAVVVANHRVVSTGYNGAPAGLSHCLEKGCWVGHREGDGREICLRSTHAEVNALLQARTVGETLYSTHKPCYTCLKMILNSGVRRVVWFQNYEDALRDDFMLGNPMPDGFTLEALSTADDHTIRVIRESIEGQL